MTALTHAERLLRHLAELKWMPDETAKELRAAADALAAERERREEMMMLKVECSHCHHMTNAGLSPLPPATAPRDNGGMTGAFLVVNKSDGRVMGDCSTLAEAEALRRDCIAADEASEYAVASFVPPATGVCECGDPSAMSCVSCIVADYQAQHPSCTTCCPLPYREAATPPARAGEPSEAIVEAGESANDRFERLADEFYADTGLVAPGKDDAPECALSTTYEERVKVWKAWNAGRRRAALAEQEGT